MLVTSVYGQNIHKTLLGRRTDKGKDGQIGALTQAATYTYIHTHIHTHTSIHT